MANRLSKEKATLIAKDIKKITEDVHQVYFNQLAIKCYQATITRIKAYNG
jgi:hypothetical protein